MGFEKCAFRDTYEIQMSTQNIDIQWNYSQKFLNLYIFKS